jgi:hypothetical protein
MKYNSQNTLIKPPFSPYKMDRESDRFRVCDNCGREFMAYDRSLVYCNEKCRWEYHNTKKNRIREEKKLEELEETIEESNKNTIESVETTVEETINEKDETILKSNISILESLNVAVNGTKYTVEALVSYGFQFSNYNGRGQLFNIDPIHNCHFTQVGNFRLHRVEYSKILITNLIHAL